ncbi:protein tramtrack, alpha isoform-like [Macrobrachium nipponense]|uniref:protein tramtrack, alpha isoform-like n=1 Tax=Macrobrachium nipponense TaxID=159736 RepID=UPI0030C7F6D8
MDLGQQFCLRWNNYQSTLQHVFYKLWQTGTFVDASLVVEGRRIDCHKVVLSACSSYFEDILQEHSSQHHPLILLHDMPFKAVEALVAFMYRGEVNVSHTQLESLLQVAEALKVKGLADSSALSNFTKRSLLERCMPLLEQAPGAAAAFASNRFVNIPAVTYPTTAIVQPRMMSSTAPSVHDRNGSAVMKQATKAVKRLIRSGRSPGPKKKRPRNDKGIQSLPSSPVSVNDSPPPCDGTENDSLTETSQPSPTLPLTTPEMLKQEAADETDGELQIDESVGQSPEGSVEGDSNSAGGEGEKEIAENGKLSAQDQNKTIIAGAELPPLEPVKQPQQTQTPSVEAFSAPKERKSIERTYTHLDLEQGIEAVLLGRLTPAKAIAHYRIPRRTFFRRLSAVRKSRGIPSAKENAADQFLNTSSAVKESNNQHLNSVSNTETYTAPFKVKSEKQLLMDTKDTKVKCNKKNAAIMTASSSYLALLKLAASNNYDTYIKYLRMVAQQSGHSKPEEVLEALKKVHMKEIKQTVDDNRNVATEVSGTALCLVNKNLTNEVPESPLSLVNGNKNHPEVPDGSEALCKMSDRSTVAEVPDDSDSPINLHNGKELRKTPEKVEVESPKDLEISEKEESDDDSGEPSPGSPSQDAVAEIPQDLILPRTAASNSASDVPQNLVSRNNKMTAEVS